MAQPHAVVVLRSHHGFGETRGSHVLARLDAAWRQRDAVTFDDQVGSSCRNRPARAAQRMIRRLIRDAAPLGCRPDRARVRLKAPAPRRAVRQRWWRRGTTYRRSRPFFFAPPVGGSRLRRCGSRRHSCAERGQAVSGPSERGRSVRQITPGRARVEDPEDAVDDGTMLTPRMSGMARMGGRERVPESPIVDRIVRSVLMAQSPMGRERATEPLILYAFTIAGHGLIQRQPPALAATAVCCSLSPGRRHAASPGSAPQCSSRPGARPAGRRSCGPYA